MNIFPSQKKEKKGVFVQFTADVLVVDDFLCQAFALKLASFFFFFFGEGKIFITQVQR